MGLLLGFSVMTAVEFIDFLFLLLLKKVQPEKSNKSKIQTIDVETADQTKRCSLQTDTNRWVAVQGMGNNNQQFS